MRARDIVSRSAHTLRSTDTVEYAARVLADKKIAAARSSTKSTG